MQIQRPLRFVPVAVLCIVLCTRVFAEGDTLPPDVLLHIDAVYPAEQRDQVCELLRSVTRGVRTKRCVLYLAQGSLAELRQSVSDANRDYRDVISWAEYNFLDPRDFDRPFDESRRPLTPKAMREELARRLEQAKPVLESLARTNQSELTAEREKQFDSALANLADTYWLARAEPQHLIREQFDRLDTWELLTAIRRFALQIKSPEDSHWLRRGLAVAMMENGRYDYRDLIVSLVILRAGAERAGIDPTAWFDRAISSVSEDSKAYFVNARDHARENVRSTILAFGPSEWRETAADAPQAGMGLMVGEVTSCSALVQLRLTDSDRLIDRDVPGCPGVVRFVLESEGNSDIGSPLLEATAERDFLARASFTNLQPNTRYIVWTRLGEDAEHMHSGPTATFRTLPGAEHAARIRFVVVTGMNYAKFHGDDRIDREQHLIENNTKLPAPYSGPDKHLGYPALETIRQLRPDFFIGTGDNVYYDTPDAFRAKTVEDMRQKWHEQFIQPRYQQLFSEVPTYWMMDDHDYRVDDGDNTGDYDPSPALGRKTFLEQLPIASAEEDNARTYRTHRVTRDLQIWLPENRMHRSPNAMPDGPDKSIWGEAQRAWLKSTLAASDATFKLLISPTPMIGPDDLRKTDNHTNIGGFRHERDAFFAWLGETGIANENFYLVCGDRHWQYHSIHPTGLEEFSCGALVDANSRLGRKPGDPKSTDSGGLIRQPYCQKQRSGGFLLIDVSPDDDAGPATLTFRFHDERGELLHEHCKTARGGER